MLILFWKDTGPVPVTGTLSKTLANVTASATAKVTVKGATSRTLANVTLVSTGKAAVKGSLSRTLGNVSLSSTAKAQVKAAANIALQGVTSPSTAVVPVEAANNNTLQNVTLAATAKAILHCSVSNTLADVTLDATAGVPANPVSGSVSQTLEGLTFAAAANVAVHASLSVTLETLHGMSPIALGAVTGKSAGGTGYSRSRGTVGKLTDSEWDKARKAFAKARRKRIELEAKTNPKALKQLASAVSRETQAYLELASIDAIKAAAFKADAAAFYAEQEEELMFILALAA